MVILRTCWSQTTRIKLESVKMAYLSASIYFPIPSLKHNKTLEKHRNYHCLTS